NATFNDQVQSTQPIIEGFDGLMARITALNTLPWIPSFFIFLLFLVIETTPIFAKLISPKGPYDYKLEDEETAIKTIVKDRVLERELSTKTNNEINKKVYTAIVEDQELYAYKLKKTRELMQLKADAYFKRQQKII
ncbi:MAG: DUF4407 domain-containing protein, partial [Bizionia sp.]|nr:DUF4407 domain-containing protein [Bizionia sp.]